MISVYHCLGTVGNSENECLSGILIGHFHIHTPVISVCFLLKLGQVQAQSPVSSSSIEDIGPLT